MSTAVECTDSKEMASIDHTDIDTIGSTGSRYRLFSENNSMLLPASWPSQKKDVGDGRYYQRETQCNERTGKQNVVHSNVSTHVRLWDAVGGWPREELARGGEQIVVGDSNGGTITDDVHRRLQEQLACKQREVQELQQKIAKNKKWADPRKGTWERQKNVGKPPIIRSVPEVPSQGTSFDQHLSKKKNDGIENTSTLDPNSPCFYPSQSNGFKTSDVAENLSAKAPCGGTSKAQESHGHGRVTNVNHGFDPRSRSTRKGNAFVPPSSAVCEGNPIPAIRLSKDDISFINKTQSTEANTMQATRFDESKFRNSWHTTPSSHGNPINKGGLVVPPIIKKEESDNRRNNVYDGQSKGNSENPGLTTTPNTGISSHDRGRLRIVRKIRSDVSKSDFQQHSTTSINCPSCKLSFKWPYIIPCFHTFCFPCIAKMFDETKEQIKCPTCSNETELIDIGPEQLHLDFIKCKTLLSKGLNPFACTSCSLMGQAEMYCQECKQFFCTNCKINHDKNESSVGHRWLNVKMVKEMEGIYFETCLDHTGRKMDQYCEECKELICRECTAPGQGHDSHRTGDVARIYHAAMNKIRLMNSNLDQMKNEVQKRMQPLTLLKQDIETSIRLCKQDIHKYSNFLLSETENDRAKARQMIDKVHNFAEQLEAAQNTMVQTLSEHPPLTELFNRYRFSASPKDFLLMAPSIKKKMMNMEARYDEIKCYDGIFESNFSFKADYCGLNEYLQNQYNQIIISENLSDALPSDSSQLGRRIEKDILAVIERGSDQYPARTIGASIDNKDPASGSGNGVEIVDPQSEMFNYNRTALSFIHQFGQYGRGEYEFVEPSGVMYLLDGSLAVCDTANHRIMIYDDRFNYTRTIGQPPNLPPLPDPKNRETRNDRSLSRTPYCLYFPYRIAQCPQTENIVVIERPPSRDIQIFTVFGQFITCFGSDILQHPRGVTVDENGIIVTVEGRTMKLMLFSQEGKLLHRFYLSVHLEFPNDVAARDGLIYISDNRGHCVHVFNYSAEPKRTIGNESVSYYPIGVSLTHKKQVVITDNHNTFNISVFDTTDGRYLFGFKSKVRHANCYNVAVHPHRLELAVTSRENQVVVFNFEPLGDDGDSKTANDILRGSG